MKILHRLIFLSLALSLLTVSCINSDNKKLLVGNWKGAEWLVNGNPSEYDAKLVSFQFAEDGGYQSDFGGDKEKGTYIVRDEKLFTTRKVN